jgi:hypothetical protein
VIKAYMAKLNKRQIIIVVLMALFILYGVYEYLIAAPARKSVINTKNDAVEINSFVTGLTNELIKDSATGVDLYIISRAESEWKNNPFMEKSSYREYSSKEGAASGKSSAVKIIYSGFVDAGKKKMAVINGVEYGLGEQLELEGYVLKNITSSKVVLYNKNTGSEVSVPIQE